LAKSFEPGVNLAAVRVQDFQGGDGGGHRHRMAIVRTSQQDAFFADRDG
jgi:hypothetical protein